MQKADICRPVGCRSYVSSFRAPLHCCASVTEAAFWAASQVLLVVAAVAVAAISAAAQQAADEVCSLLAQTCMFALQCMLAMLAGPGLPCQFCRSDGSL